MTTGPSTKGPIAMSYMTRDDIPYHYALADAFTVGDAYYCSIMGPTNPNRCYMWTGCIGNVNYLGSGGTDGMGAGPVTANGLSVNDAYYVWETFPEVLQAAGVSWKIYQDLAGVPFAPDFGDGTGNAFAGNFTDNSVLYFNQYATAAPGTPLFDNAATGTEIINSIPSASGARGRPGKPGPSTCSTTSEATCRAANCRRFPGSSRRPAIPNTRIGRSTTAPGTSRRSSTSWCPTPRCSARPSSSSTTTRPTAASTTSCRPVRRRRPLHGASTVSIENEIVTTSTPNGPIGLGTRVPFLAISPWSKGGYVNSQVFDHTSVIQFIEKRFGVVETQYLPVAPRGGG